MALIGIVPLFAFTLDRTCAQVVNQVPRLPQGNEERNDDDYDDDNDDG